MSACETAGASGLLLCSVCYGALSVTRDVCVLWKTSLNTREKVKVEESKSCLRIMNIVLNLAGALGPHFENCRVGGMF